MFHLLLGVLIGLGSVVLPGGTMLGLLLSSYLGSWAVIGCFAVSFVLGTKREIESPGTTGNVDLLCVASTSSGVDAGEFTRRKVTYFFGGVCAAIGMSLLNVPSMPAALSWIAIVFVVAFSFKHRRLEGVIALGVVAALVNLLGALGFSSAALVVIIGLGLVPVKSDAEAVGEENLFAQLVGGLASGVLPGLSAAAVIGAFKKEGESLYIDVLLAEAVGEGLSLGVFCLSRATSKTGLTTMLGAATRGQIVEGTVILAVTLGLILVLSTVDWKLKPTGTGLEVKLMGVLSTLVVCLDNTSPAPLVWGGVVAMGLYIVSRLIYVPLVNQGKLPKELRCVMAAAPILFSL